VLVEARNMSVIAPAIEGYADLIFAMGNAPGAARMARAADALRRAIGSPVFSSELSD
jgi:hypothetical protein